MVKPRPMRLTLLSLLASGSIFSTVVWSESPQVATSVKGSAYAGYAGVESLGWLSGCWREDLPDGYFEEYWMAPAGKTLLQMGRMVAGGKTLFYETLQIREHEGQLSLLVIINGKRQVRFEVAENSPGKIVFRTPPGEPQERLSYEQVSKDELYVRLEKTREGKPTVDEFHLKRVDCQRALSERK